MPIKPRAASTPAPSAPARGSVPVPSRPTGGPKIPTSARPAAPASRTLPAPAEVEVTYDESEWFGGFGAAKARRPRGSYIAPGQYILEVMSLERRAAQKPGRDKGSQMFIARFRVVDVEQSFEADNSEGPDGWPASNVAGEEVVQILNVGRPDAWDEDRFGDLKALMLAIYRCSVPDLRDEDYSEAEWVTNLMDATADPGDMFAGYQLRCRGTKKMIAKGTRNFTVISYWPHAAAE